MKKWYYIDLNNTAGPFKLKEIIDKFENNEINSKNYFWCSGLKEWDNFTKEEIIRIDTINTLQSEMPDFNNIKSKIIKGEPSKTYETTSEVELEDYNLEVANVFVKISGILLFIVGILNLIISMLYIGDTDMGMINGMNIIFGIAFLFIGYGVLKFKKVAYDWAIASSLLNLAILVSTLLKGGKIQITSVFFIFILYSLIRYKKLFKI